MVSGMRNGINSVASKDRGIKASPPRCVFAGEAQLGRSSPAHIPWAAWEAKPSCPIQELRLVFMLVSSSGGNTLEQVMVKGLVGRKHCRHLVVVGRVDVLINTVARELHLPQREGKGQKSSGGCAGGGGEGGQWVRTARDRALTSAHSAHLLHTQKHASFIKQRAEPSPTWGRELKATTVPSRRNWDGKDEKVSRGGGCPPMAPGGILYTGGSLQQTGAGAWPSTHTPVLPEGPGQPGHQLPSPDDGPCESHVLSEAEQVGAMGAPLHVRRARTPTKALPRAPPSLLPVARNVSLAF